LYGKKRLCITNCTAKCEFRILQNFSETQGNSRNMGSTLESF
jgi:hypothetical protein